MIGLPSTSASTLVRSTSAPSGLQLHRRLVDVGRDRVDFEAVFVAPRQGALNAAAKGEHRPDAEVGDPLNLVDVFKILRVGHGDAQRVADLEQRNRIETFCDSSRNQPHRDRIDHAVAESRGRHAQMAFDIRQNGFLLNHAHLDQGFAEPQTLLRTFRQRPVQLVRRDDVGPDQLLAERDRRCRVLSPRCRDVRGSSLTARIATGCRARALRADRLLFARQLRCS